MKKKIVILSLISLLLLPIANFVIQAQGTYVTIPTKTNYNYGTAYSNNQQMCLYINNDNIDIRGVYIRWTTTTGDTIDSFYPVCEQTFKYNFNRDNPSSYVPTSFSNATRYRDNTTGNYFYTVMNGVPYPLSNITGEFIIVSDLHNHDDIIKQYVYKYTFGDGAIEPSPSYGQINNLKYYSNLLTSNPAGNVDTIYWDGYQDTNGNDITSLKIEIKAESGYFTAQDRPSLLQETFANWIRDTKPSVQIYKGTTLQEKVAVEWQTIANQFKQNTETLGQFFWSIFAKEGWYYQYGWRYYARLLDENEDPISEWQELIQATSYTPQATETLTDDEPLTPDDVDTINDINNQNNTTNNWYVNNTVINNNEYNNTYQQNIIENIYNILQGTPDENNQQLATDTQNTVDNAINTEDDYTNQLQNQLNNLELNDISQNNGLIKALRWVREVHKETIEDTVFGEIVLTIMLIGLITYLIGRRNG